MGCDSGFQTKNPIVSVSGHNPSYFQESQPFWNINHLIMDGARQAATFWDPPLLR